jgi:hypothetical protein
VCDDAKNVSAASIADNKGGFIGQEGERCSHGKNLGSKE